MIVPKLPSLFKRPDYKRFEYKPLYYDAVKEEAQRRRNNREMGSVDGNQNRIKFKSVKGRAINLSNLRLVAIIVFLLGLAYYIMSPL